MTTPSMPTIVIFGAGAVGRGFIGELFSDAGWLVSFLDIDPQIICTLQAEGCYEHRTVGVTETTKLVGPVTAGYSTDPDYVAGEIATAWLIATSVGAGALPQIIPVLRDALLARLRSGGDPIDVLLCENLPDAAAIVRGLLNAGLDESDAVSLDIGVGLVETSIGRMIPISQSDAGRSPTSVSAEPYRYLPIDAAAMKGPPLRVAGIVADPTVDFAFYEGRKLYIHNMGHYLCGLLAHHAGHDLLWQGAADPGIRYVTRAAMIESAVALSVTYDQPLTPLIHHVDDLLHRFDNRNLGDTVSRVVRDPRRKLAPDDRLLGAYTTAIKAGTPRHYLSLAVAAGAVHLEAVENWSPDDTARYLREAVVQVGADCTTSDWSLLDAQIESLRTHGFIYVDQLALIGDSFTPSTIP